MKAIQTTKAPWFEQWFDSTFYHQLYSNRDEQEAVGFIDQLMRLLDPKVPATMMDLGCGAGRHAKYLASKGFKVTGTDLSVSSISTARRWQHDNLHFYRHDMRKPFGDNHYDYVFNFFTSFGYFKTDDENLSVINNIARSLKPGGILVMDYLNAHIADKKLVPAEEKEIDGLHYHITRWSDSHHIYKKIQIDIKAAETLEFNEQVAKIYLHQFKYMFEQKGLQLKQVFGNYQLDPFRAESSPRLILIAEKI